FIAGFHDVTSWKTDTLGTWHATTRPPRGRPPLRSGLRQWEFQFAGAAQRTTPLLRPVAGVERVARALVGVAVAVGRLVARVVGVVLPRVVVAGIAGGAGGDALLQRFDLEAALVPLRARWRLLDLALLHGGPPLTKRDFRGGRLLLRAAVLV